MKTIFKHKGKRVLSAALCLLMVVAACRCPLLRGRVRKAGVALLLLAITMSALTASDITASLLALSLPMTVTAVFL